MTDETRAKIKELLAKMPLPDADKNAMFDIVAEFVEEQNAKPEDVQISVCGVPKCKHEWGDEFIEFGDGVNSVVCKKCGISAFNEALWSGV